MFKIENDKMIIMVNICLKIQINLAPGSNQPNLAPVSQINLT